METLPKVLYINHKEKHCGVYQFGVRVYNAIRHSKAYNFIYAECTVKGELFAAVKTHQPSAIIYNHYPSTMPWLNPAITKKFKLPQIGTMHEVTQEKVNSADTVIFDFHLAPDPTILLTNPIVFKTGRLVPAFTTKQPEPETVTIGSFGFGTRGKGFPKIIEQVQKEFDRAIIRLNIPSAAFGDADGSGARIYAEQCNALVTKQGIDLHITFDFMELEDLLRYLESNTVNVFFYEEGDGRGIASVIDWALAVDRPIAITRSKMFRHVWASEPSICIEDTSLKKIIDKGTTPLQQYKKEWTPRNLCWDYERIVKTAISNYAPSSFAEKIISTVIFKTPLRKLIGKLKSVAKRSINKDKLMLATENKSPDKIKESIINDKVNLLFSETVFNRILDNSARKQYEKVISLLFELCPDEMSRKIPEANIQQAFVFETVRNLASKFTNPKILSVGCYEDTAFLGLKKLGFDVEGIDPVLNYDLSTFMTKPGIPDTKYDIIFSTSVIEHVFNDDKFVNEISQLLRETGFAIFTCDYKQDYKKGDKIPSVDFRFYTKNDLEHRLVGNMPGCSIWGSKNWDGPAPDFWFEGLNYTFASLVVRKN